MARVSAAIDFGSNSFRLLISRAATQQNLPLVKELRTVRLGENLNKTGIISPAAMQRALAAVSDFSKIINTFQEIKIKACGTAALRAAANSKEFITKATAILGTDIHIISAAQEAQLTLAGCLLSCSHLQTPVCIIDCGGGSTELIMTDGHKQFSFSEDIGAVNITEHFFHLEIPSKKELQSLRDHVKKSFHEVVHKLLSRFPNIDSINLIGCGGCATALAALDLELAIYDSLQVQGHLLSLKGLNRLNARLNRLSVPERNNLPGLDHGRGEIIIAGLLIIQTIMEVFNTEKITISDTGLLEGILLSTHPESSKYDKKH